MKVESEESTKLCLRKIKIENEEMKLNIQSSFRGCYDKIIVEDHSANDNAY